MRIRIKDGKPIASNPFRRGRHREQGLTNISFDIGCLKLYNIQMYYLHTTTLSMCGGVEQKNFVVKQKSFYFCMNFSESSTFRIPFTEFLVTHSYIYKKERLHQYEYRYRYIYLGGILLCYFERIQKYKLLGDLFDFDEK